ncbi:MAG: hypothetical protein ACK4VO_13085 [Pseudobdellovibrio sp.]
MKKLVYFSIFIILVFYLQLLFLDNRILLSEVLVKHGDSYFVEGYGQLGEKEKQDILVCNYFNGRKKITDVFWYASNNFMGRNSCKFFVFKDDDK